MVTGKQLRIDIIHDVHQGLGNNVEPVAMSSHLGRTSTILDQNPEQWPYAIDDVLFAHRVSRHASTNYSSFYLMYNREPVSPVDLKYGLNSELTSSYNGLFDQDMFETVLASASTIRVDIHEAVGRNLKKAHEKQKRDFDH